MLGCKKQESKPWITNSTLQLINNRKEARTKTLDNPSQEELDEYNELRRSVKHQLKRDKRNYYKNLAAEAELASAQNRMRDVYNITKKLSGKTMKSSSRIRNKEGDFIDSPEEAKDRWVEHFSEILNRPPPEEEASIEPSEPLDINTDPPPIGEIKEAIRGLKNNKSAGPDNIVAEILKADLEETAKILKPLIDQIWHSEVFPDDWRNGHLTVLPKKGDLTKCGNYRGIMLLSVPGKVLSRIILSRIKSKVDKNLRPNQAGFRPGRSCADQTAALRIIIEQCCEWNASLYINFVDYEKAFDSLDRKTLWKLMAHYGIPAKIVNLTMAMYNRSGGKLLINGKLTDFFEIRSGVRQGCLLSPFLFLLAIDWIMASSVKGKTGIQWSLCTQLEDLDYADDLALLSGTHAQMQEKTRLLAENSLKLPKTGP